MKLQIAMDFDDMEKALSVLREIADKVDIIECGTDMLIRFGIEAVSRLKNLYPDKLVLCDRSAGAGTFLQCLYLCRIPGPSLNHIRRTGSVYGRHHTECSRCDCSISGGLCTAAASAILSECIL